MKRKLLLLIFTTFIFGTASAGVIITPDANGVLYVNKSALGGAGNSWGNALKELADALKAAKSNTAIKEIWVAKGTYKPLYSPADGDFGSNDGQNNAFSLIKDVKLYGGFAGTESTLTERNLSILANATILSGDIDGNDSNGTITGNNTFHVVISAGAIGTAQLDGFTIIAGKAVGSGSITVNAKTISIAYGGGIYMTSSSPVLKNLLFSGNSAGSKGGGMYLAYANPVITNVTVSENNSFTDGAGAYFDNCSVKLTNVSMVKNKATNKGGGFFSSDGSITLTNVTISGNTADSGGGGIRNISTGPSGPKIRNSVIWGNKKEGGAVNNINNSGTSATYSYSLIEGSNADWSGFGTDGGDNIDGNPLFTDAANGDYTLQENSPAVNKGNDDYFDAGETPDLSDITTDLAGQPRIQGGAIDMGAFESLYTLPVTLVNFTAKAESNFISLQWHTASEHNNKGFEIYRSSDDKYFVKIGEVSSEEANTLSPKLYTFTDKGPLNGNNYYKLVQVDNDGAQTELGIRTVKFGLSISDIRLYPNPTADSFTATFEVGRFSQLIITDINGRILQKLLINSFENSKSISLITYPEGTYLVKLIGSEKVAYRKVIKR